jgi:putative transcriptional regulator
MNINAGTILLSTSLLDDSVFEKAVIFIAEYNEKGALGFIINQPFPRRLNELVEFKNAAAFPLYDGGPVEQESLFVLHQRPDLIEDSTKLTDVVYMGGNFKQVVDLISRNIITADDIKLFIGYCGWDSLQLEEEIEEGSWLMVDADIQKIFAHPAELLWGELFKLNR